MNAKELSALVRKYQDWRDGQMAPPTALVAFRAGYELAKSESIRIANSDGRVAPEDVNHKYKTHILRIREDYR